MKKLVRVKADPRKMPPLTEKQRAELDALGKRPDSAINYDDIPPLDAEFWRKAIRKPFYRPTKSSTTIRIDSDVLTWLKSGGKGYQTRINSILRRAMIDAVR